MNRTLRILAPYAIALLVPTALLGVVYALGGRSPLWGLVGGAIGLVGALLATATRVLLAPQMNESEVEALARELDESEHWEDTAHGHEGLRRLHQDMTIDEARRINEARRHVSPYDDKDEPPER